MPARKKPAIDEFDPSIDEIMDKPIDSLTVSTPQQIDFFEMFDPVNGGGNDRYSNTIELYDSLPKYNWSIKKEFHDLQEAEIVRTASLRGQDYKIVIKPAILNRKGKSVLVYPGQREEVVEDALRKLAVSGQGQMLEDNAGVTFTLTQLKNELQARGHTYNIREIKEAIMICRGATLECYGDDGESLISSNFFPTVGLTTRQKYINNRDDALCYVTFNPMVTRSILDLTFRQYNYRLGMEIPSPLARFIYKRMSHYWNQASMAHPYTPNLMSFLRQSPRQPSEDMYSNTRAMTNALNVLVKHKVISHYEQEVIRKVRKILDIRYKIYPHEEFIKMVKAANYHSKRLKDQANIAELKDNLKKSRKTKRLTVPPDPNQLDF